MSQLSFSCATYCMSFFQSTNVHWVIFSKDATWTSSRATSPLVGGYPGLFVQFECFISSLMFIDLLFLSHVSERYIDIRFNLFWFSSNRTHELQPGAGIADDRRKRSVSMLRRCGRETQMPCKKSWNYPFHPYFFVLSGSFSGCFSGSFKHLDPLSSAQAS